MKILASTGPVPPVSRESSQSSPQEEISSSRSSGTENVMLTSCVSHQLVQYFNNISSQNSEQPAVCISHEVIREFTYCLQHVVLSCHQLVLLNQLGDELVVERLHQGFVTGHDLHQLKHK